MKILDIPRSGSYAGITSSHNRAGQYVRNRRAPVQPIGTGRRAVVRANFGASAAGYAGLSTAQQDAWTAFANTHPITDSLGQTITLTGQQMYVRVSSTCLNVLGTPGSTPPASLDLPDLSAVTVAYTTGTGLIVDGYTGSAGMQIALAVSQPVSAGRRFWKTFWQPLLGDGVLDATTAPHTLTEAIYQAQFGTPVGGQRIFVRLTPVSTDFWNGPAAIFSCIAM